MSINAEPLFQRPSLFNFNNEIKGSRTNNNWTTSKSSDSEESSSEDIEESTKPTSYDINSNLYRDGKGGYVPAELLPFPYPPPSTTLPKYPKEKQKTFVAFSLVVGSLLLNSVSIALTHDRVPDSPPLPDALLDTIHIIPELMRVPDVFVIITLLLCFFTILLHRHRWIVARRVFFILSILYLMRSVTIYSTVLPVANYTVYCSPKSNSTSLMTLLRRVGELLGGGGMQISGKKNSCGDYVYSGHTALLISGYLILKEYSPTKFVILHWISLGMSWCGMAILLIARGHYTIDILIGYYAATRMFWTYHSLCNNVNLKTRAENNYYSNVWWFPIFQYLEGNVKVRLPKQYSLPWSLHHHKIRHAIFR